MAYHFKRRLSEALTLERSERGALVIANIDDVDGANQELREGDEVVGATIKFDRLTKDEVMGVLKMMEPYDDRIQVLTKNNMSRSMGNLNQGAVSPETMLHNAYNKLYDTKIKRFMHKDMSNGENLKDYVTLPRSSKLKTKQDSDLPRLGVDFGRLSPDTLGRRYSADSESNYAAYGSGAFEHEANLNLPPLGVGQVNAGRRVQVPQMLNARAPSVNSHAGVYSEIYPDEAEMALRGTDGKFLSYDDIAEFDADDGYDGSPAIHLAGQSSRLNAPQFDLNGRSGLQGSAFDVDGRSGGFDIKGARTGGDVRMPNAQFQGGGVTTSGVRSKVPSGKYKAPKFTMPSYGLPTVEVPEFDGDIGGMDMPNVPKFKVDGRSASLGMPDVDGKFQSPNFKMPDYDLNGPDLDLRSPNVDFSGPNLRGDVSAPDLKMPKLGLKSPNLDLNMPDLNGPNLKGGIDGPNWDANLKAPKLDLNSPDVDLPNMPKPKFPLFGRPNFKGRTIEPDLDDWDMDVDTPKFKLKGPKADLGMPNYDLNAPNLALKSPDLDLGTPNLKGGLNTPDLKMPKLGFKTPTLDLKSPNLDLPDVHAPDLKVKTPKLKGGIHGPDLDLPDAKFKTPKLDMGSPKARFKFPKLKMPKLKRPSLKSPDLNVDLDSPDMDVKAPKLNLKGPKADLGLPNVDLDGKFKKPNLNMPGLGLNGPKIDGPNLDLSGPNLHGGINTPDLNMPKLGFKTPTLGVKSPNMDFPHLQGPDLNLKTPKLKGNINGPDWDLPSADLKGPKFDLKGDINMSSPKAKMKMPKFKLPKFGRPSLKGPDIDADFDGLDMDVNVPKLKGPNADLGMPNIGIDGKFKKPNLNMPDLDLNGPKIDGPNLDLTAPNLSGPNLHGGINAPGIKMPKLNLKSPKLDFKGPDVDLPDLNGPDVNLKAPKIKGGLDGPDLNLKAPKIDLKTPDINIGSPKGRFKFPKMKMPKLKSPSLKSPDLDVDLNAPDMDINAPTVNLKGSKPNLDLNFGGKLKKPNLTMPKMDFKSPKLNLNAPKLDLKSPKLDLNAPKLDLDTPDLDVKAPDLNLKAPKLKGGLDFKSPDLKIDAPKAKMKLPKARFPKVNMPTLNGPNIDGPDFDIDPPDVDFGRPSGKYRKPHFKVPDVELSGPNVKSPKYHGKLKGPDVNVKAPKVKGSWDTPKAQLPNVDLKAPRTDWNAPETKYKKPHMKMPKGYDTDLNGGFQGPDLSLPDVRGPNFKPTMPYLDMDDIDVNGPDVSLSGTNGKLRTSDLDVDDSTLKYRKLLHGGSGVPLPGLDLDQGMIHSRSKGSMQSDLDFTRSDLNIDDFTGKYHVPGSDLDLQLPSTSTGLTTDQRVTRFTGATLNADSILHPSHAVKAAQTLNDGRWSYSQKKPVDTSDGYMVTVFPSQEESEMNLKQKYGSLGGLNFGSGDVNLEVPDRDELKGSTFLFSNLV
ncbi:neuroblast differentiation-associated protein AHNAK-like [Syngnathus typhle]|uniref:neuroblast differentiation-associated protein AHNAK-like n=1 Tax=Syngnathus typhle TaxID=161592 RepID=UPI002A6A93D2|nr:neuroblast differentiation-associated protein AHNAK-like [Syngnathus typhle]XP_061130175.1 neuroblast differentiation-associated protein AHNAK-like [Syngnathus typhle]